MTSPEKPMNGQDIWTRRATLGAAAGLAAVLGAASKASAQSDRGLIEWNEHMFSSDVAKYPFHPSAPYKPDTSRMSPDPTVPYLKSLAERGIDRAVLVQPEPYGDDHTLMLDCLRRTAPDRYKGTSLFYPKDPEAPRKLAALVRAEPRVISTRFHRLHGNAKYMDSFADSGVRALWKQAADLGLVIEIQFSPEFGPQVGQAIAAFPGCKVLIDHLALPHTGTAVEYASVLELAKYPNVYMKLSELAKLAKDAPTFESILPFTRRVIKEFAPDRLVWSGGSPRIADVHMAGYSQADIAKAKGGNLRRLIKW